MIHCYPVVVVVAVAFPRLAYHVHVVGVLRGPDDDAMVSGEYDCDDPDDCHGVCAGACCDDDDGFGHCYPCCYVDGEDGDRVLRYGHDVCCDYGGYGYGGDDYCH